MPTAHKKEHGQALLVILLVMAVILTIALSIASRSVTDISVSKQEDDASRAFSAAEAGIEQALNGGTIELSGLTSGGSFKATVQNLVSAGIKEYLLPTLVASGESVPVWFVNHDPNDNSLVCNATYPCSKANDVSICWGNTGTGASTPTTPAIEITANYTTSGNDWRTAQIGRAVVDPFVGRGGSNNFSNTLSAPRTISGVSFPFCATLNLETALGVTPRPATTNATGLQIVRLKLLYNTDRSHYVGIVVNDAGADYSLPPQGSDISSTGQSGDAARKIQVQKLYRDLPSVFEYGLYSGGGLTQ